MWRVTACAVRTPSSLRREINNKIYGPAPAPSPGQCRLYIVKYRCYGGAAVLHYLQTTVWDHSGAWIALTQPFI